MRPDGLSRILRGVRKSPKRPKNEGDLVSEATRKHHEGCFRGASCHISDNPVVTRDLTDDPMKSLDKCQLKTGNIGVYHC